MHCCNVLVTLLCTSLTVQSSPCSWVEVLNSWSQGYKAVAKLQVEETVDHWDVGIQFSEAVISFEAWKGDINKISDTNYSVSNTCYNNMVYSCQCFELPYIVRHDAMWKGNTTFMFNEVLVPACDPADTNTCAKCRCSPSANCWPSKNEWQKLNESISGRLKKPISPIQPCLDNKVSSASCNTSLEAFGKDPFCVMKYSGGTLSTGQVGAWIASQSKYVVEAENVDDIVKAVNFAKKHNLRLIVKGTGHDYNGRSNSPDSLLIWTYKMRSINFNNSFTPIGSKDTTTPVGAVTVGPGLTWVEVYINATENNLFVLGGACASVGVVGFTIGGGYGTLSKSYGLAATNLLEATIITATEGKMTVSAYSYPNLFYALRGGGGGFGVVASMTFKTHEIPKKYISTGNSYVTTNNFTDFKDLVLRFLDCYKTKLIHQKWGDQVRFKKKYFNLPLLPPLLEYTMEFGMTAADISYQEATDAWKHLKDWLEGSPDKYDYNITMTPIPGKNYFTLNNSNAKKTECDPSGTGKVFFWDGDDREVSEYWLSAINTRYLKYDQFLENTTSGAQKLMTLFEDLPLLTEQIPLIIHLNMGQYGVTGLAKDELQKMPLPPSVKDSFGLLLVGFGVEHYSPLVSADLQHGTSNIEAIQALCNNTNLALCESIPKIKNAMNKFRDATPGAGSYFNMAAYFEPNFEENFWGEENYKNLTDIKKQYDEHGLFNCHNCVGSKEWSKDGMCRF